MVHILPSPDDTGSGLQVGPLVRTDLGMRAVETIKSLITSGGLQPGDTLPAERDLAAMLGISRPSMREAIRVLRAMNIVETRHGDRTYVSSLEPHILAQPISFMLQIAPTSINYLFEARLLLEADAATLAASRAGADRLLAMSELIRASAVELDQVPEFVELDHRFHTAMVEATGNPILGGLYRSITELLLESRVRTAGSREIRERSIQAHMEILNALRAADAERAADAVRRHLSEVQELWEAANNTDDDPASGQQAATPTATAVTARPGQTSTASIQRRESQPPHRSEGAPDAEALNDGRRSRPLRRQ